jgi:perosamine synthetase
MNNAYSIPWARPVLGGNEERYVVEALRSSWISGGAFVDRLETLASQILKVSYPLTCSNGTSALHLAFLGLGLKADDEVILPGFGFLAAANIALQIGLQPIFAEVDPDTWCVTAESIEKVITKKTRCFVVTHTYATMCDMEPIMAMARSYGIDVVEDCAESLGSELNGQPCGTFGSIGTFSFQATKTITTGEGGMVTTTLPDLYEKMSLYRNHGMNKIRYWHEVPGNNFRLTNLQAAVGCAQFEKLEEFSIQRKEIWSFYNDYFQNIVGLKMQQVNAGIVSLPWVVGVKLDPEHWKCSRDDVMTRMGQVGVETRPGFYPPSKMKMYNCGPLPLSEALAESVITLPTFPGLTLSELEFICQSLVGTRG